MKLPLYKFYILKSYLKYFLLTTFIFFSLSFILNILQEIGVINIPKKLMIIPLTPPSSPRRSNTPYTFLSILILKLFRKKVFLYLRSDGFKEHEVILGKIGKLIYGLMFYIASNISSLIACREHLLKKNNGFFDNP